MNDDDRGGTERTEYPGFRYHSLELEAYDDALQDRIGALKRAAIDAFMCGIYHPVPTSATSRAAGGFDRLLFH